jgi:Zn-dependent membrane protease YugP
VLRELLTTVVKYVSSLPEVYITAGFVILAVFAVWWAEWLSKTAISVIIWLFRFGGRHGPVGSELAARMLAAAGEEGVTIDDTPLGSGFRRSFGEIDYRPDTGVLELTADKATGRSISSAGLITLEVGRALQHRRGFPLVYVRRVTAPVANFAGFVWIWPAFLANFLPVILPADTAAVVQSFLYMASTALVGLLLLYMLLTVPLDLDAARRGVAAMKRARAFTPGEALAIRVFLGIVLALTLSATALVALNVFRATISPGKI